MNNEQQEEGDVDHSRSRRVLQRLMAIEEYSLANYVLQSSVWTRPEDNPLLRAIHRIARKQQAQAARVGRLLARRYGFVESGQFPLHFTALNDLSLDYVAQKLIEHQRSMIDEIESCDHQLQDDPEARHLTEEILASEQRRLIRLARLIRLKPARDRQAAATSAV
jgi:hypothetical protein